MKQPAIARDEGHKIGKRGSRSQSDGAALFLLESSDDGPDAASDGMAEREALRVLLLVY